MNNNQVEMYDANSRFYILPTKKEWVCRKPTYSFITIVLSIVIGVFATYFLTLFLFNNISFDKNGIDINNSLNIGFVLFAPILLFISCIYGCLKYSKKLFVERKNNYFKTVDIFYAVLMTCLAFLKSTLICYLIIFLLFPFTLLLIVLFAIKSVFKLFSF